MGFFTELTQSINEVATEETSETHAKQDTLNPLVFVSTTEEATSADIAEYSKLTEEYKSKCIQYEKNLKDWENDKEIYKKFIEVVGTEKTASYYGSTYTYNEVLNGNFDRYLNILNHIIDFEGSYITVYDTCEMYQKHYTTSLGYTVTTNGNGGDISTYISSDIYTKYIFERISEILNSTDTRYCNGEYLPESFPTEYDMLASDYIKNYDNTYTLKTLKQKAIDLYYIIQQYKDYVDNEEIKKVIVKFTECDLKNIAKEPKKPEVLIESKLSPPNDLLDVIKVTNISELSEIL